jgi:hypothetical protein
MKKLILPCLALAALAFTAPSFADAECQAGSAYGPKPGCPGPDYGGSGSGGPVGIYHGGVPVMPGNAYPAYPVGRAHYPIVLSDGRTVIVPQQYSQYPQYRTSRRDRDGDGVTNRMDRFPDDPSRW